MVHFIKKLRSVHIRNILFISLLVIILLITAITSRVNKNRATVQSKASEINTVKIMTFNILGGGNGELCASTRNNRAEMGQITNFIKNNNIIIAALQEAKRISTDDCELDLTEILEDLIQSPYQLIKRQYIGSNDYKWYRLFIYSGSYTEYHKTTPDVDPGHSQGAESIVLNTKLGKIRFINIHPQPGQQGLHLHEMLVPYVNSFKSDGIPMIIMGDTNLRYDFADAAPVLKAIENAGFYRACDPIKFPRNGCDDTVKGADNYAIDYIFIDKRATFYVKNAFVEQSMLFSDHLPMVVELTNEAPPTPTATPRPTSTITLTPTTTKITPSTIPQSSNTPIPSTATPISPNNPTPTKVQITFVPTQTHTPFPPSSCSALVKGDLNCDGVIGAIDVGCWLFQYRSIYIQYGCENADVNNNNAVDILDFTIIKSRIGK